MEKDFELGDFFKYYKPFNEVENYQQYISSKKEFLELSSGTVENVPKLGEKYKHQEFFKRIMISGDEIIVLDETGTGKSCEIFGFSEFMLESVQNPYILNIKKIYVISSKTVIEELKTQLVCKCTQGKYNATNEKRKSENKIIREINKNISQNYQFMTYGMFIKMIKNSEEKNEPLSNLFSNSIIWIDEIHVMVNSLSSKDSEIESDIERNLEEFEPEDLEKEVKIKTKVKPKTKKIESSESETDSSDSEKKTKKKAIKFSNSESEEEEESSEEESEEESEESSSEEEDQEIRTKKYKQKAEDFKTLVSFFRSLKEEKIPCKKIVTTATPMLNTPGDLLEIFSLYLSDEEIKQFKKESDYDTKSNVFGNLTSDIIAKFLPGKINYIRSLDTNIEIVPQGEPVKVGNKTIIIKKCYMIDDGEQKIMYDDIEKNTHTFQISSILSKISNMVFPNIHYYKISSSVSDKKITQKRLNELRDLYEQKTGTSISAVEMSNKIRSDKRSKIININQKSKKLNNEFSEYINIIKKDEFSFTSDGEIIIAENISEYAIKYKVIYDIIEKAEGVVFIHQKLVQGPGMAGLTSYLKFKGMVPFEANEEKSKVYCTADETETDKDKKLINTKIKRFALLTGDTDIGKMRAIKRIMTSKNNIDGYIVKAFLVTDVGQVGININHVTDGILVDSNYNPSVDHQTISRFIRVTSHVDLLNRKREQAIAAGLDPNEVKVIVKTYRLAAVSKDENGNEKSMDIEKYTKSYLKFNKIKKVMRMLIQVSNGCQVNYIRNTRSYLDNGVWKSSDKDGSENCNFDICLYKCYNNNTIHEIDYSTYDYFYLDENVEKLIEIIKNYFLLYDYANLDSIIDYINQTVNERNKNFDNPYLPLNRNNPRIKHIKIALFNIISKNIIILNKFSNNCFLHYDKGIFYLDQSNEETNNFLNGYYTENLFIIEKKPLEDVFFEIENERYPEVIDDLKDSDNLDNDIKKLSPIIISIIVEKLIDKLSKEKNFLNNPIKYLEESKNKEGKVLLKLYKTYWDIIYEPKGLIIREETISKKKKIKMDKITGRIATLKESEKEEILKLYDDEEDDKVFVNYSDIFSGIETGSGEVAKISRFVGKIRVKHKNLKWRFLKENEIIPYRVTLESLRSREFYIDKPIYIKEENGKPKLIDTRIGGKGLAITSVKIANKIYYSYFLPEIKKTMKTKNNYNSDSDEEMTIEEKRRKIKNILYNSINPKIRDKDPIEKWDNKKVEIIYRNMMIYYNKITKGGSSEESENSSE